MVKTGIKKTSQTFGRRKWGGGNSPENLGAKIPGAKDLPNTWEHKTETKMTSHKPGSPISKQKRPPRFMGAEKIFA
jgi:hypothetical protein